MIPSKIIVEPKPVMIVSEDVMARMESNIIRLQQKVSHAKVLRVDKTVVQKAVNTLQRTSALLENHNRDLERACTILGDQILMKAEIVGGKK